MGRAILPIGEVSTLGTRTARWGSALEPSFLALLVLLVLLLLLLGPACCCCEGLPTQPPSIPSSAWPILHSSYCARSPIGAHKASARSPAAIYYRIFD